MKKILLTGLLIIFLLPAFLWNSQAQDSAGYEFKYDIVQIYKPLSMARASLLQATKVEDLHRQYKDAWVKTYLYVDISAWIKGKKITHRTKDQILSETQKQLMLDADRGTEIEVLVHYIPENTLKHNDPKDFDFSFMVNPEQDAYFLGGKQKLQDYIKKELIDNTSWDSLGQYQLAVANFVVDVDGAIIDASLFWSSDDEVTDARMIDFVCNMPAWMPAQYDTGKKVAQEFALTIGDNNSCVVPLLNVREN